jgi:hypothetical protein
MSIFLLSFNALSVELNLSEPNEFDSKTTEMIAFIEEWSTYVYTGEPLPEVEYASPALVQIYAYGDFVYAQAEHRGESLPLVNAVYDRPNKKILISESLKDYSDKVNVSLIHELVHYMQDINGYTDSLGEEHLVCSESEAYDIQILWQIINEVELDLIDSYLQDSLVSAMRCMGSPFAN